MLSTSMDDSELVARLRRRDPQAMVDLYDRYGRLLYSIILRLVRTGSTAEDLTQEAFLRAWNRIHTFKDERGNLQAWLVTIARNRGLDYLRSLQSSPALSSTNLDDLERAGYFYSEADHPERIAKQNAVAQALKLLPEEQREVLELTHFDGMTQTEIAEKLGKPLGTVKGLVRGALKKLRNAMRQEAVV